MSAEKPAKDRALVATLAAGIAGSLTGIFQLNRQPDEARTAKCAVRLARMILAEIDAPPEAPAAPAPATPEPARSPGADLVPETNRPDPAKHAGLGLKGGK